MEIPDQKAREIIYLERCFELLGLSNASVEHSEAPDFLYFPAPERRIGIEVTELHNPKIEGERYPSSQRHGTLEKIVDNAHKEFTLVSNIPLTIEFRFVKNLRISRNRIISLSKEISGIVCEQVRNIGGRTIHDFRVEHPLPKEMSGIYGYYHPSSTTSIWYPAEGRWLPDIDPKEVQKLIDKKNVKVADYLQKCDEVWLLIVEGIPPYSWFDNKEEAISVNYLSSFQKIIMLRSLSNKVYELAIQRLR